MLLRMQVIGSISGSGRITLVDNKAPAGEPTPVDLDLEKARAGTFKGSGHLSNVSSCCIAASEMHFQLRQMKDTYDPFSKKADTPSGV